MSFKIKSTFFGCLKSLNMLIVSTYKHKRIRLPIWMNNLCTPVFERLNDTIEFTNNNEESRFRRAKTIGTNNYKMVSLSKLNNGLRPHVETFPYDHRS